MINKLRQKLKGFTLVETLIAVLLLATAIAGPLTIASKSLIVALVAKDQVTAFFLAQDGVEYIRFIRDTNKLQNADWIDGTGGDYTGVDMSPCLNSNGCYTDSTGQQINSGGNNILACGSLCPFMRYGSLNDSNPANDRFRYWPTNSTNEPTTIFRRTIKLTPGTNPEEATVEVTVSWSDTGGVTGAGCPTGTRCVIVRENIFDWQ